MSDLALAALVLVLYTAAVILVFSLVLYWWVGRAMRREAKDV